MRLLVPQLIMWSSEAVVEVVKIGVVVVELEVLLQLMA
jgi:hypothetical protein